MTSALHTPSNITTNPVTTNPLQARWLVAVIAVVAALAAVAVVVARDGGSTLGPVSLIQSAPAAGPSADLPASWTTSFSGIPAAGPNADIAQGVQR